MIDSDEACGRHGRHSDKPVLAPCGSAISSLPNKVGTMTSRGEGPSRAQARHKKWETHDEAGLFR
jgi:hypothetical protein